MRRKNFIKHMAVGGGVLLASPAVFNACTKDQSLNLTGEVVVDLTDPAYSALGKVGGYAYKDNIIIIRTGDSTYMALSKLCTHQQCTVFYSSSNGELLCPCHGSAFSTSGEVLNGPAASNLKSYTVTVEGDTLKIS